MTKTTFFGWCLASGILVAAGWGFTSPESFFKGLTIYDFSWGQRLFSDPLSLETRPNNLNGNGGPCTYCSHSSARQEKSLVRAGRALLQYP